MNDSQNNNQNKILKRIVDIIFYFSFLFFIIAFNFQDNKSGGWYQQWLPGGFGDVQDIVFQDSLQGWIKSGSRYLLYTTNGGDNWSVNQDFGDSIILCNIQFVNKDSAILCEANSIYKTINHGQNWTRYLFPGYPYNENSAYWMHAINFDTIWIACGTGYHEPRLYLTTNGGISWTLKFSQPMGLGEFVKIYFYNKNIGFCCRTNQVLKTTNGGNNWVEILAGEGYTDIHFVDSLTGWKNNTTNTQIKKTTNGGLNWTLQTLPSEGGHFYLIRMNSFHIINKDTIWGVGGQYQLFDYSLRGMIYKTTNGGLTWGYQLPDTLYGITRFKNINFVTKRLGWAYVTQYGGTTGVHTTVGGNDTTIFTGVNNNRVLISKEFVLEQNYPNPFNQLSIINYKLSINCQVKLDIYDIMGKLVKTIINQRKNTGNYNIKFDGSNLSSGIYFYRLEVTDDKGNIFSDVKKMSLIK